MEQLHEITFTCPVCADQIKGYGKLREHMIEHDKKGEKITEDAQDILKKRVIKLKEDLRDILGQ